MHPDLNFSDTIQNCQFFLILMGIENMEIEMDPCEISEAIRARCPVYRIWCVVELHAAIQSGIPISIRCGTGSFTAPTLSFHMSDKVLKSTFLLKSNVEDCDATVPAGRNYIEVGG